MHLDLITSCVITQRSSNGKLVQTQDHLRPPFGQTEHPAYARAEHHKSIMWLSIGLVRNQSDRSWHWLLLVQDSNFATLKHTNLVILQMDTHLVIWVPSNRDSSLILKMDSQLSAIMTNPLGLVNLTGCWTPFQHPPYIHDLSDTESIMLYLDINDHSPPPGQDLNQAKLIRAAVALKTLPHPSGQFMISRYICQTMIRITLWIQGWFFPGKNKCCKYSSTVLLVLLQTKVTSRYKCLGA